MFERFKKKKISEEGSGAAPSAATPATERADNNTENNEKIKAVKYALNACTKDPANPQNVLILLKLFVQNSFMVPMTSIVLKEDAQQLLSSKPGDVLSFSKPARFRPDILKNFDGLLYFPAFTSKEEASADYRIRFSWMPMSGKDIINAAMTNKELSGVVINAFSESCTLKKELLQVVFSSGVVEYQVEKGEVISLSRLNHNYKALHTTVPRILSWDRRVKKAFLAKMVKNGKPQSILLLIDGDIDDPNVLFGKLNAEMLKCYHDLPLDFGMYQPFMRHLRDGGIMPVYSKEGYGRRTMRMPMDDSKFFYISQYRDDENWLLKISLDFERADDVHVVMSGSEAYRLIGRLCREMKTNETRLPVLIHDYLGEKLKNTDMLVLETYHMLDKFGVIYKSFRYD